MVEVEKLQALESSQAGEETVGDKVGDEGTPTSQSGRDEESKAPAVQVQVDKPSEKSSLEQINSPTSKKPQLSLPTVQSSRLAAAIVQSAPIDRRAVFLRPSSSFDHTSPSPPSSPSGRGSGGASPRAGGRGGLGARDKRRSWHMERFTMRYLASGGSLSSIPALQRSLSSEGTQGRGDTL